MSAMISRLASEATTAWPPSVDAAPPHPGPGPDRGGGPSAISTPAGTPSRWPRVVLGGAPVDLLDEDTAVQLILAHATSPTGPALAVMSANLDHVHHFGSVDASGGTEFTWAHPGDAMPPGLVGTEPRWLNLLDGAPLVARAKALTGRCWPRLAGSDLITPILDGAETLGLSVGFLGGMPETHTALRHVLSVGRPSLRVAGLWAPERSTLCDPAQSAALAAEIRAAGADILVVGLGKPRQEQWIVDHGAETGARVLLAFGAVVDFLAGRVRRAPTWVSHHCLEWAWRLGLEPRRLWRRYLVQGPPAYWSLHHDSWVLTGTPPGTGSIPVVTPAPAQTAPTPGETFAGPDDTARVAVVVVTHNSAADVDAVLAGLRREAATVPMRVIVADNDSSDGTLARLTGHPDVTVIPTGGNLGYAGGINVAARWAGDVEALLVLNPDLTIEPGAVRAMLGALSDPTVGAVVPTLLDPDGSVYPSLRREPSVPRAVGDALFGSHVRRRPAWLSETEWDQHRYAHPHRIDWATGAALLVRASTAEAVGPWDERYFLYSEETDYCRRVRDAGWSVLYEPAARMRHAGGGSGASPALTALLQVNKVRYAQRHAGRPAAGTMRLAVLLGSTLRPHDAGHRAAVRHLVGAADPGSLPHATREMPPEPAESSPHRGSVVIPAHDEARVIGRTLRPLAEAARTGVLEVVVACNGCSDDTAAIARSFPGVRVLEIDEASKCAALRAADRAATLWPRCYLDADIELDVRTVTDMFGVLERGEASAVRPRTVDDVEGAHWPVRAYYRARGRVPSLHQHLWGAGVFAVTEAAHARFGEFPDVTADDLWVDRHFRGPEKAVVDTHPARVRGPRSAPALLSVLRRVYRGNAEQASSSATASAAALETLSPTAGTTRTVHELVRSARGPVSAVDAVVYATFAVLARLRTGAHGWERDESSRV